MKIVVKLFAGARELAGSDEIVLELPSHANFAQLRGELATCAPQLKPICERALFAADGTYVADEDRVAENQEIALIPPVSGG
jgi:molybdopterin converting factor small subunit